MEPQKATTSATAISDESDGGDHRGVVIELPLGAAAATFNLEKAVCSHGLFMMAPNYWDPLTKTLQRPLRLSLDFDDDDYETSLLVRISQPSDSPHAIQLRVLGTSELSSEHLEALLAQVRWMLHLSKEEDQLVRDFQEVYAEAKERGFGRVFRSPTLFEDMVKCILLCNCQWSRTLSMARALCELQLELQCSSSMRRSFAEGDNGMNSGNHLAKTEHFVPRTPAGEESKIKYGRQKRSKNLAKRFKEAKVTIESDGNLENGLAEVSELFQETGNGSQILLESNSKINLLPKCNPCQTSSGVYKIDSFCVPSLHSSEGTECHSNPRIGNFPSPKELAKIDEHFLAKRCNLGYRASRILNLARGVVEGRIQLRELEGACRKPSLSNYEKLAEQLKEINGFGPFTCANVLMCMGFYHVIPTDSETIRHLKQVHARNSTSQTVQREVEVIYGKYSPFQFLAYWSEVWHFYEEWFGKLSEMPHTEYKLITAANMRPNRKNKSKRAKTSLMEKDHDS